MFDCKNKLLYSLYPVLATALTVVVAITAAFFLPVVSTPALAADLLSSYQALKNDPESQIFLDRLLEAGATEADLESFLNDLDRKLREGETLTEANFNSEMLSAFEDVAFRPKHESIFNALLEAFLDEIIYIRENERLPSSLVLLGKAVKSSLLGTAPPGNGGGGGSETGPGTGDVKKEEDKEAPAPDADQDKNGAVFPTPVIFRFADLKDHWAQEIVEKLAAAGLVAGVRADRFEPQRQITRAEFTTLLVRALAIPTSGQLRGNFEDVAADAWYFAPINVATSAGLVKGVSSTRFEPNQPLTREQLAVMVAGTMEAQGKTTIAGSEVDQLLVFRDWQQISSWAQKGVAATVVADLVQGRPDGTFAPRAHATRAEAATLIYNLLQ